MSPLYDQYFVSCIATLVDMCHTVISVSYAIDGSIELRRRRFWAGSESIPNAEAIVIHQIQSLNLVCIKAVSADGAIAQFGSFCLLS